MNHTPLNNPPYNPDTIANKKGRLTEGSPNVSSYGRTIAGYRETGKGAYDHECEESGRMKKSKRVVGTVIKATDHPNKAINRYYG